MKAGLIPQSVMGASTAGKDNQQVIDMLAPVYDGDSPLKEPWALKGGGRPLYMTFGEDTDIKVFLRSIEYDDFLSRFYEEVTLSASGMCVVAAAKRMQEDLSKLSVAAVIELGMPDADRLAVLKKSHYDGRTDPGRGN